MKKFTILMTIALTALSFWPGTVWAESPRSRPDHAAVRGGYGGPATRMSVQSDGPAMYIGGRGGILLWDILVVGGGGFIGIPEADSTGGTAGYGGLALELLVPIREPVRLSFDALLGGGGADYTTTATDSPSEGFLVAEGGVSVNVLVTKFMMISPGVRYLQAVSLTFDDTRSTAMSGFSAGLQLRFGSF